MNELIKVDETKLSTYNTEHKSMMEKLLELEEHKSTVNTTMNKGTWEGSAYEACKLVLVEVNSYLANYSLDYMNLNSSVNDLISNTDAFVKESAAVQKLS